MPRPHVDRMSDLAFRLMAATFRVVDLFRTDLAARVDTFGLEPGMTVVDYGCGPGRYVPHFSERVGVEGEVYAVDVHELAVAAVERKAERLALDNVRTSLAHGYNSRLPTDLADVVCALDMIFGVRDPESLLAEFHRILKPDGMLILDDGHQPRATTREKLASFGRFQVVEETGDHLKCRPVPAEERR